MPVVNIRDGDGNIVEVLSLDLGGDRASLTECLDGSISGEYIDNKLTTLRMGAFAECANLTKISLPNCTNMTGSRHFYNCASLETVELDNVDTASELGYTFAGATNLQRVSFPKLVTTGATGACFDGCTNLVRVDFDKLSGVTLGNFAFRNCKNLKTIVIGGTTVCPLASPTQVLTGASSDWKLYVPANLVSDYEADTNWNQYIGRILAIPEGGVPE